MPERDIDSDDPQIIDRAEKTVKPAKTLWDAARAINLWVYRNIEYAEITGSASETFKTMKGDSRAKALVCAALCRAAGIPARIVTGIIYAEGPTDHTWVEVYLGEEAGWGPIDPTLGEADRINAAHISLWLGTPQPPVYAKDVALDGVNVSY
jgi:transglutaminase-like putative cysteine protease